MDLENLKKNWDVFARYDPMWSILADPKKSRNKWKQDEFFATGKQEITALMHDIRARKYHCGSQNVLDFGCGIGRLTQSMTPFFETCYGVDISSEMIEHAKRLNRHGDRCKYFVNEEENLKIFESDFFDCIYSNIVLQHIDSQHHPSYVREFLRILKPHGLLIFQLPSHPKETSDPPIPPLRARRMDFARGLVQTCVKKIGANALTLYQWRLGDIPAVMEMNCFERAKLESFIILCGAKLLHAEPYDVAGPTLVSFRYYVTKEKETNF